MSASPFNSAGGFSSGIPEVVVIDSNGNVVTNVLTSGNVTANAIYATYYNYANGHPITGTAAAGSNNQVQYNSNNFFAGSSAFTFDPSSNTLTVSGNVVANSVQVGIGANNFFSSQVTIGNTDPNCGCVSQVIYTLETTDLIGVDLKIFATDESNASVQSIDFSVLIYGNVANTTTINELTLNNGAGNIDLEFEPGSSNIPSVLSVSITPLQENRIDYKILSTIYPE